MEHRGVPVEIDEIIISSTVPRVAFNLLVLCAEYFGARPIVVGKPECMFPVAPRVDEGAQVGTDRLVNAAGAFKRHGGDVVVVDFGTATTFDVVDSDCAYSGGVIAPGVNLSLEALHMGGSHFAAGGRHEARERGGREHRRLHAIRHSLRLRRSCARDMRPHPR